MKLSQVDLNLLVVLDAVIRTQSLTRAGQSLDLRQPAMNTAISRLRELLGDPLLERVGRDYRLTPLAEQLAEPVQTILSGIERTLNQRSSFDPRTSKRVFRLAGSDYMACAVFQPLLAHVRRIAPGVQLRFQGASGDTGQKLAALELDLSLQQADSHNALASHELFSDRFVCATWNGNALVNGALTESLFCSLGHVAYVQPSYDRTVLDRFGGPIAQTIRVQAMTDSCRDLPFLLRGTSLIALVQERLGLSLRAAADVRLLACPLAITPFKVSMWWNRLYNKDVAHTWLRSTLIELTAQMDAFASDDHAAR